MTSLKSRRLERIKIAISQGAHTLEEISREVGVKPITLYREYRKLVDLPKPKKVYMLSKVPDRDLRKDELIVQDLTLNEIGDKLGLNRETIRLYALLTGQSDSRGYARNKISKKSVLSKIVSQINEVARRKVSETDCEAYEKAETAYKRTNAYSSDKLFGLFREYYAAKREGKKVSLEHLGNSMGIDPVCVGRILKKVGEGSLNGTKVRNLISDSEKKAFLGAAEIGFSPRDIDRFMNYKQRAESFLHSRKIKFARTFESPSTFSMYKASEIYQSLDLGFNNEEIFELTGVSSEVYNFAIENRKAISAKLIQGLRILYPEKDVNKPYLSISIER